MPREKSSRKKIPARQRPSGDGGGNGFLRIGDVARMVGMSPSMLRAWERLGLTKPVRTSSRYRLYSPQDVRLLKRAQFLRRSRGLNAAGIVDRLRLQGLL